MKSVYYILPQAYSLLNGAKGEKRAFAFDARPVCMVQS